MKIRCANCGRSLTVADEDGGQVVMCSACGQRLTVPMPALPVEPSEPDPAPPEVIDPRIVARPPAQWWGAPPRPPQAIQSPVQRPVFRQPEPEPTALSAGARMAWAFIGLLCVGLIGLATFLAVLHQRRTALPPVAATGTAPTSPAAPSAQLPATAPAPPGWNPAVRSLVIEGAKVAEEQAVMGHLKESDQLYVSIEQAAATQPSTDPYMLGVLDGARVAHAQVLASIAAQPHPVTQPVTEAVAVPHPSAAPATRHGPTTFQAGALHVHKPTTAESLSDARIGESIRRGVDYLIGRFDPSTHELRGPPSGRTSSSDKNGRDALCVYALLQAGEADPDDERLDPHRPLMRGMLDALDKLEMEERIATYGRSLRASALGLADRKEDRATLQADAAWLLSTHKGGAYGYGDMPASKGGPWDHSNTQYGQLGVWAAQDAGIEVESSYWVQVQKHWEQTQNTDGTWSYTGGGGGGGGTQSMTSAGLASLFVAEDRIGESAETAARVGRPPFRPALAKALAWFEGGDNVMHLSGSTGYSLYGVERVGLASGMKFFGSHDWYRELARQAVASQAVDGSWGGEIDTAYTLLFLSRGRHPILMNKLRFDGPWANRPRDAANLAHFATHELERPLNWQVVSVGNDYEAWSDSPILYLASHEPVYLTNVQVGQLRRYVESGGMLFTHADAGSKSFNAFAEELAAKLFPEQGDKPLRPLPADSDIFSILYRVDPAPPLEVVTNGVRPLMIHSPVDISAAWQQGSAKIHPNEFHLGVNLFLYVAGKGELRNRLSSMAIPPPPPETSGRIALARINYGPEGGTTTTWDPEPAAWPRFASWFGWQTGCAIELLPTPLSSLTPETAPIAHLTGVKAFEFSDAEVQKVRAYVDGGGTLLIDCAGGSAAFADSITRLIGRAFPDRPLRPVPLSHPVFAATLDGMEDLTQPLLRPYALRKLGPQAGNTAIEMLAHGKGRVLYTNLDLTAGLLGTRAWGILGFEPPYAESWVKNLVLWVAAGAPDKPRAAEVR